MSKGVFVTGTDTDVGKTVVACALLHALIARGISVMPMKPIAAGVVSLRGPRANADSLALLQAAGRDKSLLPDVTPILLIEAMAPHIAAEHEGRTIKLEQVRESFDRLSKDGAFMVVEGVGGFRVPLTDDVDTVDMAKMLALPVVLVVGLRLGCLNHALVTVDAIAASGLPLAGWVANAIDPKMAAADKNVAALVERIKAPLLGRLPCTPDPDPAQLAQHLDVGPLLTK
jgi:dethiobiotin synthetase